MEALGCMSTATGLCAAQCRLLSEPQRYEQCVPGMGASQRPRWSPRFMNIVVAGLSLPLPLVTSESLGPRRAMRRGLLGLAAGRGYTGPAGRDHCTIYFAATAVQRFEPGRVGPAAGADAGRAWGRRTEPDLWADLGATWSRTCGRTGGRTGLDDGRTGGRTGLDDGRTGGRTGLDDGAQGPGKGPTGGWLLEGLADGEPGVGTRGSEGECGGGSEEGARWRSRARGVAHRVGR